MNFLRLRPIAHVVAARSYTTTPFVPPRSLDNIDPKSFITSSLPRPQSPTFYTARSDFYDGIRLLENALNTTQRALRAAHLFPFPDAAKRHLPPARLAWKNADGLSSEIGATLTTSRRRRVLALLAQLNDLRRIALAGAEDDIAARISTLLEPFERPDKNLLRGRRKPISFDEYGRTYAVGRRKESSARVWMIPIHSETVHSETEQQSQSHEHLTTIIQAPLPSTPPTPTTILINNLPLSHYFPHVTDRQRVVRPLKLAGVLGAFNVFCLVRGGGTTGQAGAVAHGIAKNIVAHVPDVELILRRGEYPHLPIPH